MALNTDWQGDAQTTPGKRNDELASHLRGMWNSRTVLLAVRTPAQDAALTKALIDALVANTAGQVDPRKDAPGWRIYTT
jgi:hypothetical protein